MKELLFEGYWPFWIGGPALAGLVIVMWFIEKRSLGVSGSLAAVMQKESETDKAFRAAADNDEDALADAMMKATLEEFGQEAVEAFAAEMAAEDGDTDEQEAAAPSRSPRPRSPASRR